MIKDDFNLRFFTRLDIGENSIISMMEEDPESLDPEKNYQELIEYVKGKKRPEPNYTKLLEYNKVVCFGESHPQIGAKDEVIKVLKDKKNTITHLGLEMFPEAMQRSLDGFFDNGNNEDELADHLRKYWNYDGAEKKYMEMVKSARECGIRILGINNDFRNRVQREYIERIKDEDPTLVQNQYWAVIIDKVLYENKNSKIVTYSGSGHLGFNKFNNTFNGFLGKYGIFSSVINFIGDNNYISPLKSNNLSDNLEKAISEAGLNNERLVIDIKRKIPRKADFFIHLPRRPRDIDYK